MDHLCILFLLSLPKKKDSFPVNRHKVKYIYCAAPTPLGFSMSTWREQFLLFRFTLVDNKPFCYAILQFHEHFCRQQFDLFPDVIVLLEMFVFYEMI